MTVAEAEGDEDRVRTAERKAKLARRDTAYFPPMDVPDEEENPTVRISYIELFLIFISLQLLHQHPQQPQEKGTRKESPEP